MPRRLAVDLDLAVKAKQNPLLRLPQGRLAHALRPPTSSPEVDGEAEVYHTVSVAMHGPAAPLTRAAASCGITLLLATLLSVAIHGQKSSTARTLQPAGQAVVWSTALLFCTRALLAAGTLPRTVVSVLGGGPTDALLQHCWAAVMLSSCLYAAAAWTALRAPPQHPRPSPYQFVARYLASVLLLSCMLISSPQAVLFLAAGLVFALVDTTTPACDALSFVLLCVTGALLPGDLVCVTATEPRDGAAAALLAEGRVMRVSLLRTTVDSTVTAGLRHSLPNRLFVTMSGVIVSNFRPPPPAPPAAAPAPPQLRPSAEDKPDGGFSWRTGELEQDDDGA